MVDILHRIGVQGSTPMKVHEALTTLDGLSGWWAEDTSGDPAPGGVIQFRFGPGGFDMKVMESETGRLVLWEVVDGPADADADAAIDAAITVYRWNRRLAGDARKRNAFLQLLYKGG